MFQLSHSTNLQSVILGRPVGLFSNFPCSFSQSQGESNFCYRRGNGIRLNFRRVLTLNFRLSEFWEKIDGSGKGVENPQFDFVQALWGVILGRSLDYDIVARMTGLLFV